MRRSTHRRETFHRLLAGAIALLALAGCWLATTPTAPAVATLPTQAATPLAAATPTQASALPPRTVDKAVPATQPGVASTPEPAPLGIVYSDENGISWADPSTGELLPLVAGVAPLGWALQGQRLATVRGRYVEVVELTSGQVRLLDTGATTPLTDVQLFWSGDSDRLLYVGWVEPDPEAEEPQQELLLSALAVDGAPTALAVYSGPPAMLLGYDGAAQRALLWAPGPEGEGLQVLTVDPATGLPESTVLLAGLGELALGPQGQLAWLAEASEGRYVLVTGTLATATSPQALALADGAYATQLTWSPDGQKVAYLLRRGALYDPEAEELGLYVLDVATRQANGPIAEISPDTTIRGWTPDSARIVLRYQNAAAPYYATIGLDGRQELLALKGAAALLGWATRPTLPVDAITLDAWHNRFASAAGDAQATAAAAASFVTANPKLAPEQRLAQLRAHYVSAGWPDRAWQIIAVEPALFILEAPPASIVLAAENSSLIVGQGEAQAARAQGDQLAVLYSSTIGGARQWSATLLQKQQDAWQIVWQPLGHNDWITTDGAVAFQGKGIKTLEVTGTSLGLPADAFFECAACPLRQLAAIWELTGAAYVRVTKLPQDAPLAAIHWEMTARTPYALVYEAVRRWRAGEPLDELTNAQAAAQLAALELSDPVLRLVVSSVTAETVILGPADAPASLEATLSKGRLVAIGPR